MEKNPLKSGDTVSSIKVKRKPNKQVELKVKGDISNTQIAILGLKACMDAGVEIPESTWKGALGYIRMTQNQDGGWGYYFNGMKDATSYSSMTCAGCCSIAICKKQKSNGSWWTGIEGVQWHQAGDIETADTCFAILFLTRATPPLTPTEGSRK